MLIHRWLKRLKLKQGYRMNLCPIWLQQMLMSRAQAGVKSGMTKLNRTVAQHRSNHILQVIIFGLTCFSIVYLWSKHFKR
ncbi:hypothetical protein Goarm_017059 [Gossypium armourianum]|uniref:Uncharacterized protein n=1 Tax=Gossypium armourianum TaxID=34283 RepID=A0A7J9JE61_9ROSI|nr:hypothetical protein [Gossypium armourianum]